MSRPLRIDLAGGVYHVTARGDRRESIYVDDADRRAWLELLGEVCKRSNWCCHAWCQMTNHYHLLVETLSGNLSRRMRQLNGVYTQHINHAYRRIGHLFGGHYKGILVEKQAYLLELARYVFLNPVRARMVGAAGDWAWSSYRATIGGQSAPVWLETDCLLGQFAATRRAAVAAYKDFVLAGVGQENIWADLRGQVYLGSERFIEDLQHHLPDGDLREVPRLQRRGARRELSDYVGEVCQSETVARAYFDGDSSRKAIVDYFGVHYATVSRAVKRFEAARACRVI